MLLSKKGKSLKSSYQKLTQIMKEIEIIYNLSPHLDSNQIKQFTIQFERIVKKTYSKNDSPK